VTLAIKEFGVRDVFIPRPGMAFLDADIEGLELCTLAQVEIWTIKDDTKAKQLNAGMDLHCVTGAVAARKSYEDFRALVKSGNPFAKNERNMAKVPNFGKPGGMANRTLVGYARTSYGIKLGATLECPRPTREMALAEAERIGDVWTRANPHDVEYLRYMRGTRGQDGGYYVVIGHPSIGNVIRRGKATYCAACNSPFQGLGALAAGEITWELQKACYATPSSPLFGCRLVIHAYDQWVIECPIERLDPAAAELERIIRTAGARKVPDVLLRAEAVAMNRWNKGAVRVTRPDGTLLIYGTPEADERLEQIEQEKKVA
jgi:hypothetical protein